LERRLLLSGTLPSFAQPSPDAVYYTGGTSGAMTLDVTAGTIAFNANVADDGSDWQNLTVEASGSAHLIFNSPQTLSLLGLFDNATVTVSQGNNGGASNLLQLNTLVVNPTATLDLGDNSMILYYQPSEESSDLSSLQSLLKSGYNGGAWNGTGINSSSAANDPSKDTSLGYMDNNDFQSPYAGINFTQFNQIIVGYTYYGDVDLNRSFDSTDVNQLIAGRSVPGGGWEYGDFNYDGYTDDTDTTIFTDEHAKWQQQLIDTGQYTPAFRLSPLPIQPDWNTPFDGDIATFTDTVNTNLPASDYVADVYWGDGSLSIAQVTATDTPGSFRINAISPVFTTANPIMLMTLQYADGSGYQSESAIAAEPIDVLQLPPGVNASANAVYSISGPSGNVQLNLTAGSLSFDTNASDDSNYFQNLNFTVSGSAHAYFNSPEDFNALTIQGNAIVSLSRGGGGTNGNRLNVQSLSIDPNGTLDLADNALIDWYAIGGGAAARSQMQSWVSAGYNGGAWTGHGIVSSVAADDTTHTLGLGLMDNGYDYVDHSIDPSYATFAGVNLQSKNQMLVRLAYYGDANLDGQVDDTDLYLWRYGYNNLGYTGWVYGDFNYDSQTDNTTDLNLWTANYGLTLNGPNFAPAFLPTGIVINPTEGVPFSGDLATFYDMLHPSNTDPSIYQARVYWGDGSFATAQVTAGASSGYFRINALSPALADPDAVMTVTIQYADLNDPSPTYQGRPAAVSEPINLTPAVSNPIATAASASEIDLTWTLGAANASAIEVDRSTDGINWTIVTNSLPGTATSFADTGLPEATHYYYRVSAVQPAGLSAYTLSADAWTLAIAPSALGTSTSSPNEVDLNWTNNSATATEFQIERSDDGANFYTLDTTTGTTYSDDFADDGSTYWYRVEALNDNGDPSASPDAVSATTALAPPSELTATAVSASEIDLAWSDDSVTATGYEVDRSIDGVNFTSQTKDLSADTSTYSDTGLAAGSHFYYRVISLAGEQASVASNRADDITTPPSSTGATATANSSSATLTWSIAPGATAYEVDRNVDGTWVDVGDVTGGSTTTFTDSALQENTTFSYQIIAENNAGQSAPTAVSAATPVALPAAPSGLQAIPLSPTSVELIWTNNADNEQSFKIDYTDNIITKPWTTLTTTVPAGTTYYIDNSVSSTSGRSYQVFAHNSAGDSLSYSQASAVIPAEPHALLDKPAAPSGLNYTPSAANISLTWTASPSTSVTSYWVERQAPGGNWGVIARTAGTTATDTPGLIGVDYGYRIVAVNALMASDPSSSVSAHRLLGPPSAPNPTDRWGVYVWNSGYKATIFWTPPASGVNDPIDGYNVYLNWGQGFTATQVSGADAHELTVSGSAANPQFQFYITSFHRIDDQTTLESNPFSPDNNIIVLKNDPTTSGRITGASVDVSNGNHINLTTSGTGSNTVNTVAYSDDDGTDFQGYIDVSQLSINPGAKIWISNYFGDGSDLTEVDGPALPAVTGPTVTMGDSYYGGSLTWGGVISGATVQLEYKLNNVGDWTQVVANGGSWQQGSASLSGPDVEEGGSYTYRIRQTYNRATIPIAGNSDWSPVVSMGVAPFAPAWPLVTSTVLSPTSAQLLWPEASEGETDQLIEWSTDGFTTLAGSTTVGPDTTAFTVTGLTPNKNYSIRLAEQKSGAPDSLWSTGGFSTPAIESVSIAAAQDAAELGPDNHPQDGWFKLTRTGLPTDSLTVSVDLSGTAVLGTQYAISGGTASPVQVTFAPGATAAMLDVQPLLDGLSDPATTNVTATIEPPASATVGTGTATLNIAELPTLQDVTVTDKHLTKNITVATDETPKDLYVMQPSRGSAMISIDADVDSSTGEHVLWQVAGPTTSALHQLNDFTPLEINVFLRPTSSNYDFSVFVGIDRNGNGMLDQPEVMRTIIVHVYSIAIDQIISDQVPGIEQNSLNGNAGVNAGVPATPKNYLLMGTDASDAARVKVTFTHTGELPPNLGFALCPEGSTTPIPGSSTLISGDTALIIVPTASNVSISDDWDIVGFGPSLNGDDSSGHGEVSATDPRQLKIIDQEYTSEAYKFLQGLDNEWDTPPKLPTAANFLFAFMNDYAPGLGAINTPVSFTSFTDPTMLRAMHHHVGVLYTSGKLNMDLATYPSTTPLAAQVAKDPEFLSREIRYMAKITSLTPIPVAGTWVTWTPGYSAITLQSWDDYFSIGDAALSGISFYANITKAANGDIVANNISIKGTVSDVADFDWDFPTHNIVTGPPTLGYVRQAVELQARYNRTGDPGHAFEVQVQLNNSTGLGWDFTKNKEL